MSQEKVFVIEHCENCQMHQWNTRHDANVYKQHAIGGKFKSNHQLLEITYRVLIINFII